MGKLTQFRRSSKASAGGGGTPGGNRLNQFGGDFSHLTGSRGVGLVAEPVAKKTITKAGAEAASAQPVLSKFERQKAKQKLKDQRKHARRQAEWKSASEGQRQQIKQDKAQNAANKGIFVCDYCKVFEGTFSVVAMHEKTCQSIMAKGKKAGRPAEPSADEGSASAGESDDDGGGGGGAAANAPRPAHAPGLTKAEKRKAVKKAKKEAKRAEAVAAEGGGGSGGSAARVGQPAVPQLPKKRGTWDEAGTGSAANAAAAAPSAKRARAETPTATFGARAAAADVASSREVKLQKGVRVLDLEAGRWGEMVKDRKRVKVSYVGRLTNKGGKVFDKGNISFRLGRGEVIAGWDIGMQGMRVGAQRRITVPPAAGYGNRAQAGIPPNSTLCFDVTVLSAGG